MDHGQIMHPFGLDICALRTLEESRLGRGTESLASLFSRIFSHGDGTDNFLGIDTGVSQ